MKHARTTVFAYGLLTPAFVVVAVFFVYPLYLVLDASIRAGQSMTIAQINRHPLTFQNYTSMLANGGTWHDLWISAIYTLAGTGFAFFIGLGTALLLNRRFFGRRWLRTLILIPWSVPGVVAILGFLWILDSSYGVFNYLLRSLGIISQNIQWFSDPHWALVAVLIPTVWKGYPFFTLMLLAALQSIPNEYYEAARVDGASAAKSFRYITWPGIQTTAVLALVLNGLWVFKEFDFIFPSTGGGPGGATETLAIRIYNEAFSFFHLGAASALGVFTVLLCVVAVLGIYPVIKGDFFGGGR